MSIVKQEHMLWLDLCNKLREVGAVTREDLNRPVGDVSTSGCRLLGIIRAWGEARGRCTVIDVERARGEE